MPRIEQRALHRFPPLDLLRGWSIDALTAARWGAFGNRYEPAASIA
jgi:hypothetical protein